MKRRALFTGLLKAPSQIDEAVLTLASLAPYQGIFDLAAANHLLRRTGFGVSWPHLLTAVADGLTITLEKVFDLPEILQTPINTSDENDENVPIGETWVDQGYTPGLQIQQGVARRGSLNAWTIGLALEDQHVSIREKMVLFWHNHFPVANINDPKFTYRYASTLRAHAIGNFRALTKEIAIDPAMLRYLNGNQNAASSPNENFARELLELFTVGKGDLDGPGDYTNYTEDDIREMAKVMTGWKDRGWYATDETQPHAAFFPGLHDDTQKQLSHRFGEVTIDGDGENEYSTLIDIIFNQPATAFYICSKLYRWFVNSRIEGEEPQAVIGEMADLLINSDFEVLPVLRALFSSAHFFDACNRGSMIKSPMDLMGGILKGLSNRYSEEIALRYQQYAMTIFSMALCEMAYFDPPSVAGWKAYYQEPLLDRTWLNSVTISFRIQIGTLIMTNGISIFDAEPLRPDPLTLINSLENPWYVNEMIDQITELIFAYPMSVGQKNYLKEALIGQQQDSVWESEYIMYSDNPDDELLASALRQRAELLFARIFSMAEFQLM